MFRVIGATVVYGLALVGLVRLLKTVHLKDGVACGQHGKKA